MSSTDTYDAAFKALKMLKRLKKLEGTILIHEGILLDADTLLRESQETAFVREVNALLSQYRNSGRPLGRAFLGFDGGCVMIFQAPPFTLCLFFGDADDAGKVEQAGEQFLQKWSDSLGIENVSSQKREPLDLEAAEAVGKLRSESTSSPEDEVVTNDKETSETGEVEKSAVDVVAAKEERVPVPEDKLDTIVDEEEESQDPEPESEAMSDEPKATWEAYRENVETLLSKVLGRAQSRRFIQRELSAMGVSGDGYLKATQFRPFGQKLTQRVKDKTIRKQLEIELLAIVDKYIQ